MKDPEDIDLFSPEQVQLTSIIESRKNMIDLALYSSINAILAANSILMQNASIDSWQRLVFESHRLRSRSKEDEARANIIWMVTRQIQESIEMTISNSKLMGIQEELTKEFGPIEFD